MGLSVNNQCDKSQYFSLSTISKEAMRSAGLTMTAKALKELARKSPPHMTLVTGDYFSHVRQTNVYRYVDFLNKIG